MSPPIAEITGTRKKIQLEGEVEVGFEDTETLLIPETKQAEDALKQIIEEHPDTVVKLTYDQEGRVSVEGHYVPSVEIYTRESRVLDATDSLA